MERNALWHADDGGFAVLIRHGIRAVHRLRVETGNLPLAEIRMQAAARAVELALEYRIDLAENGRCLTDQGVGANKTEKPRAATPLRAQEQT